MSVNQRQIVGGFFTQKETCNFPTDSSLWKRFFYFSFLVIVKVTHFDLHHHTIITSKPLELLALVDAKNVDRNRNWMKKDVKQVLKCSIGCQSRITWFRHRLLRSYFQLASSMFYDKFRMKFIDGLLGGLLCWDVKHKYDIANLLVTH